MKWVAKEWGAEIWLCNTEKYCAKQLHVAPLSQCSLHRHLVKDETFIVVLGYPELEIGDATFEARPGETFRIEPGVWHRFTNRYAHTYVQMLEVSTHHEDSDVERREPSRRLV